jgi:FlaA1/EpsC-like NDP-sugar epimerase
VNHSEYANKDEAWFKGMLKPKGRAGGPQGHLPEEDQGPDLLEPVSKAQGVRTDHRVDILITGGAGFIGSHVVRRFVTKYPQYRIVNLDALTYAGNLENLRDVENAPNYTFVKADICDAEAVAKVFKDHAIDGVIHLAAESHVDRSISDPMAFVKTNVFGTVTC